jgi:HAD superfamily hydrolase (TIGR01509 family)
MLSDMPVRHVVTPDAEGRLAELLAGTGPLLLDFDGPVCSIFAGYPAPQVAADLRSVLQERGVDLSDAVAVEPDPLEVIRWTGSLGEPDLTRAVEDTLCAAELEAAASAEPTPYAREVIVAACDAGKPVAVVSNNSAGAITKYLDLHRLARHVGCVVGRAYAQPERMKPNPEPIRRALSALAVEPAECVLVGDSITDVLSAQAAKVKAIAYANKSPKAERFAQLGVEALIESMAEIVVVLASL